MTVNEFNKDYKKLKKEDVLTFLQENAGVDLPASVLGRVFEKFYVKTDGISDYINLQELVALHHSFTLGNGGGWCRADDSGFLGRIYKVENCKEGGRITEIKVSGYKTKEHKKKYRKVPVELLKELKDTAEGYKTMAGALLNESEETIGKETYCDATSCKDNYEIRMLKLIDEITKRDSV